MFTYAENVDCGFSLEPDVNPRFHPMYCMLRANVVFVFCYKVKLQYTNAPATTVDRRHPPFSKLFSKPDWPMKAKFPVEPPLEGGTKIGINGPGNMAIMAATPIYGLKSFKIFFCSS